MYKNLDADNNPFSEKVPKKISCAMQNAQFFVFLRCIIKAL